MADLQSALDAGRDILESGGSAQDACVKAVKVLEDSPLFNAGLGAVFTSSGQHELDAGIMIGSTHRVGACSGIKICKNPIVLAETIMMNSPHVMMISEGAETFGRLYPDKIEIVENQYFTTQARLEVHQALLEQAKLEEQQHRDAFSMANGLSGANSSTTVTSNPPFMMKPVLDHSFEIKKDENNASSAAASSSSSDSTIATPTSAAFADKKYGTVGAVALDLSGELVTCVSTGGMSMKSYGRVGGSPICGAGFYATPKVAVCCTGNGEAFIRCAVAKDVASLMDYAGLSLQQATDRAIKNGEDICGKIDFEGGLIAVDSHGNIAMPFNSPGMYRGAVSSTQESMVAVWKD